MQRPRRTSEFQEDPTGIRRHSRTQQRSTLAPSPGGTAKKYSNRQSRIAVPNRPSSLERVSSANNAFLSVPAIQWGVTPQKTPLKKSTTNRVLTTAEKQRTGSGNPVALHNDKKWVQEQTQRITEHLLKQSTLGGGVSTEFISRGLRQMSIKQFVAIINYFLGYIWGNRFIVGNNHVEDIIGILQKLQYPHPVNKSWLKTPNTQHSFGNVIVLFDFLMDFVPTTVTADGENLDFDLKDPEVLSNSRVNDEMFQIPDLEFQQVLLKNSEEGFLLWDKQKDDEFNCLRQQTCNLFIQKMCGVPDLEAIDLEIQKLKDDLKTLEKERPPEDKDTMKMKSKLSHELKNIRRDINTLNVDNENNERFIKDINSRRMAIVNDVETVEKDIKSLQELLTQQKCTVEQRDQFIVDVSHYKHMLAIEERTIQDLQERNHNQQIQFARSLKQFTDQVESFNNRMREIKFSDVISKNFKNKDLDLELSLRPADRQLENLSKIIPILTRIKEKTQEHIQETKKNILRKQQLYKQLTEDLDTKLHPKLNALRSAKTTNNNKILELQQHMKLEETKLSLKLEELQKEILQADNIIGELQTLITQKKSQVEELAQLNERTMQQAEEKHKQGVTQRKSFLDAYDAMLEDCIQNDVLVKLIQQVEMQEKQLEGFRNDLKTTKK